MDVSCECSCDQRVRVAAFMADTRPLVGPAAVRNFLREVIESGIIVVRCWPHKRRSTAAAESQAVAEGPQPRQPDRRENFSSARD
jgi:hypothetical protein